MVRHRIRNIRFGEGIERIEEFLEAGDELISKARGRYGSALARARSFATRNPQARDLVANIEKMLRKLDEMKPIGIAMWTVAEDLEEK